MLWSAIGLLRTSGVQVATPRHAAAAKVCHDLDPHAASASDRLIPGPQRPRAVGRKHYPTRLEGHGQPTNRGTKTGATVMRYLLAGQVSAEGLASKREEISHGFICAHGSRDRPGDLPLLCRD